MSERLEGLSVRPARVEDGEEATRLIRRSITEICALDHRDDPQAISGWTANKTPEAWADWARAPGSILCVAESNGRIVGVGMMSVRGEVLLNYVLPEASFQGVGGALMDHLEAEAARQGCAACTLETTVTAQDFYKGRGYGRIAGSPGRLMLRKALD